MFPDTKRACVPPGGVRMACMNIHSRTDGVYETLKDKIDLAEVVGRFADLVDHGRVKTCF